MRSSLSILLLIVFSVLSPTVGFSSVVGECRELLRHIRSESVALNSFISDPFASAIKFWAQGVEEALKGDGRDYLKFQMQRPVASGDAELNWLAKRIEARLRKDPGNAALRIFQRILKAESKPVSYARWLQIMRMGVRALDFGHPNPLRIEQLSVAELLEHDKNDPLLGYEEMMSPLALVWIVRQRRVSFQNFNALSPYPIFIYGLTDEPIMADGTEFLPSRFFDHDASHNMRIAQKASEIYGDRSMRGLRKFLIQTHDLVRFELNRQRFMVGISDEGVREAFEALYFSLWHESSERPMPGIYRSMTREVLAETARRLRLRSRAQDMGMRDDLSIIRATQLWAEFVSGGSAP